MYIYIYIYICIYICVCLYIYKFICNPIQKWINYLCPSYRFGGPVKAMNLFTHIPVGGRWVIYKILPPIPTTYTLVLWMALALSMASRRLLLPAALATLTCGNAPQRMRPSSPVRASCRSLSSLAEAFILMVSEVSSFLINFWPSRTKYQHSLENEE